MQTKSVQLTEDVIKAVIGNHARYINYIDDGDDNSTNRIERMRYLDKRLKDFNKPEITAESDTTSEATNEPKKSGW